MPAASAPPGMVTRSGSHDGLETHTVVILGLDPRIALIPYRLNSSHFSVVRAATDARVKPEHDGRRPHVHHNENCWCARFRYPRTSLLSAAEFLPCASARKDFCRG